MCLLVGLLKGNWCRSKPVGAYTGVEDEVSRFSELASTAEKELAALRTSFRESFREELAEAKSRTSDMMTQLIEEMERLKGNVKSQHHSVQSFEHSPFALQIRILKLKRQQEAEKRRCKKKLESETRRLRRLHSKEVNAIASARVAEIQQLETEHAQEIKGIRAEFEAEKARIEKKCNAEKALLQKVVARANHPPVERKTECCSTTVNSQQVDKPKPSTSNSSNPPLNASKIVSASHSQTSPSTLDILKALSGLTLGSPLTSDSTPHSANLKIFETSFLSQVVSALNKNGAIHEFHDNSSMNESCDILQIESDASTAVSQQGIIDQDAFSEEKNKYEAMETEPSPLNEAMQLTTVEHTSDEYQPLPAIATEAQAHSPTEMDVDGRTSNWLDDLPNALEPERRGIHDLVMHDGMAEPPLNYAHQLVPLQDSTMAEAEAIDTQQGSAEYEPSAHERAEDFLSSMSFLIAGPDSNMPDQPAPDSVDNKSHDNPPPPQEPSEIRPRSPSPPLVEADTAAGDNDPCDQITVDKGKGKAVENEAGAEEEEAQAEEEKAEAEEDENLEYVIPADDEKGRPTPGSSKLQIKAQNVDQAAQRGTTLIDEALRQSGRLAELQRAWAQENFDDSSSSEDEGSKPSKSSQAAIPHFKPSPPTSTEPSRSSRESAPSPPPPHAPTLDKASEKEVSDSSLGSCEGPPSERTVTSALTNEFGKHGIWGPMVTRWGRESLFETDTDPSAVQEVELDRLLRHGLQLNRGLVQLGPLTSAAHRNARWNSHYGAPGTVGHAILQWLENLPEAGKEARKRSKTATTLFNWSRAINRCWEKLREEREDADADDEDEDEDGDEGDDDSEGEDEGEDEDAEEKPQPAREPPPPPEHSAKRRRDEDDDGYSGGRASQRTRLDLDMSKLSI